MSSTDRPSSPPPPSEPRSAADESADLHAKLDRVAGLCAATVTQIDRLTRILGANQQLDARAKRDHSDLMTENRAVLRQVREALTAMSPPRALPPRDDDDESGFGGRRRHEDNSQITASLKLQIRNRDGEEGGEGEAKKPVKKIAVTVLKWAAGLAAGALGHYLIGK